MDGLGDIASLLGEIVQNVQVQQNPGGKLPQPLQCLLITGFVVDFAHVEKKINCRRQSRPAQ
jgi:hypothetical protein